MRSSLNLPASAYHSAHRPEIQGITPQTRWRGDDGSLASVFDVTSGPLPPRYANCDVLYTDLPWQNGFDTFNERAGIKGDRTYRGFMACVSAICADQKQRPVYLATGRHALTHLPEPDQVAPIRLNEHASVVVTYNTGKLPRKFAVAAELLRHLARQYDRVGDFCCGYGSAGKAFARAGKTFVLTDVNPSCIGYIAAHAPDWRPL